jgi:hypothetical protein
MRVARSAVPVGEGSDSGADGGRRRKRESVGAGARKERDPKAILAVARKVMNWGAMARRFKVATS